MAYAYPSGGDGTHSSTSLGVHSSPGKSQSGNSRKGSDEKFDILREIKAKIEEDENYIQFFQDRIRLEEEYIAGLRRLTSRSKAIDTLHDDVFHREEQPTTRRAWDEVREYSNREIQAKEAFVGVLKEVIVKELVKLKEEQGRIRQGLKENMKLSNEMYDEHAKNQLPRLKRTYWQKSQALEDHKRQEHAIAMQAKLLADSPISPGSTPLREHPNAISLTQPVEKEEKKPHGRLRAGSASMQGKDVFNDIAAQSKKGFNAIISKLGGEKSEEGKEDEGLQRRSTARGDPTRGMGTMRGVRVKREADEADKAYRLGVFHLESLRLRRDKMQTSAARNLESFNDELNRKFVESLEVYVDTLHATAATNAQGTSVPRQAIEAVNLDKDMTLFRTRLRAVDRRTAPVPYHNYYVGECRSLIFGVSLTDYDFARGEGSDHGRPPTIVEKCINAIDKELDVEGIYRISGRHAGVQKLIQGVELDEEKFEFDDKDDVFSISNVLKQYLRELPEPVFPFPQPERVKYTEHRETHIHSNFSALRGRLRRLAPIHQTTFQAIVEHLGRVAAKSSVNKMDAKNLAVVFNSVIFGQEVGSDVNLLAMGQEKDTLLEDLINYSDLLFGAEDVTSPGVFPPGAALSRSGVISYHPVEDGPQPGSSRTKFTVGSPKPVTTLFTPDDKLDLLFDSSYIPQTLRDAIGSDLHARPLASTDLMRSHFGLLATLTESPAIAPSMYAALFNHLKACPETYFILVVIDKMTDQMVAHGSVVVENKFIHGGASAGHIEDIVVSPTCRGGGVGKKLVIGLRDLALGRGCYRVDLHCNDKNVAFYEKCGFVQKSCGMSYRITPKTNALAIHTDPQPEPSDQGTETAMPGSPKTVHSTSSSGVTYSFPVPPHHNQQSATSPQDSIVQSPTVIQVLDAPTTPAWASDGLGSSERAIQTPQSSLDVATEARPTTPLPPGAAPPNMDIEPERIVEPRG